MSNAATRATSVETHSIDYIPAKDRHGKARNLFTLWFSSNLVIGGIALGALCVANGLSMVWTIVAIVAGHLIGGVFMALHSAQGPKLGIPQMIQSRAQFGFIGAAAPIVVVIFMYVGYFAVGLVLGGSALASVTGWSDSVTIPLTGIITAVVAIYGYRMLHMLAKVMTYISGAAYIVLMIGFLYHHDISKAFQGDNGAFSWTPFILAMGIAATWQLTYAPFVADISRYLPKNTSQRATFWFSYGGSVLASAWMFIFGAFVGSVAADGFAGGSTDFLASQAGFATKVFLLIIVLGMIAANALNSYGTFMCASTIMTTVSKNVRITQRTRTWVILVALVVGTAIAVAGQGNFLNNFQNLMLLLGYFLIPWTSINLVDFYLIRKERYDIAQIFQRDGIYGGVDMRAIAAYAVGIACELPFLSTAIYTGPLVSKLGGTDISWIVGIVVSCVFYYVIVRVFPKRRGESAFDRTPLASTADDFVGLVPAGSATTIVETPARTVASATPAMAEEEE